MEEKLFYSYLKYQKENKTPFYKDLFQIPKAALVLVIIFFMVIVCCFIFTIVAPLRQHSGVLIGIELLLYLIMYFYAENYQTDNSRQKIKNYQEYCRGVFEWLNSGSFLATEENIIEIKKRIENRINEIDEHRKNMLNTVFKIGQVIVFPIIIAAVTKVLNMQEDINNIIAYMMTAIVILFWGLFVLYAIVGVVNFLHKIKSERMKNFADDLQGVLDTQFINGMIGDSRIKNIIL